LNYACESAYLVFGKVIRQKSVIRIAEGSRITQRTYWAVEKAMSDQKFVKVKITINEQTYADTKVADKDREEFESELDHLLKRFEMVTGC